MPAVFQFRADLQKTQEVLFVQLFFVPSNFLFCFRCTPMCKHMFERAQNDINPWWSSGALSESAARAGATAEALGAPRKNGES